MKKGPQTVPATPKMQTSDGTDVGLSSYVPDFDVFLSDCEVPSPSNMYGNSLFADPPDYSLLGGIDDSAYAKYQPSSPDMFYDSVDQKPPRFQQQLMHHQQQQQVHSPAMSDRSVESYGDAEYSQQLEDFGSSLLYGSVETTHLDLFAASILGGTLSNGGIKKELATTSSNEDVAVVVVDSAMPRIKMEIMDDQDDCRSIGEDGGDFEKVQSLVLQQLTEDIEVACDTLHISADPCKWSMDNVHSWLLWTLRQYNLPQISLEYFLMDGPTLCSLSEDNFRQLTMQNGDILYAQLEIWKTAASFQQDRTRAATPQPQPPPPPPYKREDMNSYVAFSSTQSVMDSPDQQNSPPAACVPDLGTITGYNSDAAIQSDDETSVDGLVEGTEMKRVQQASVRIQGGGATHSHIHLWQFLKELLLNQQMHSTCIRWLDRNKGVFKIEDSVRVARLWGKRKNRPAMNYDKLSRSIRQYYKKGIMKKTERSQRLVYQFCHPYCL